MIESSALTTVSRTISMALGGTCDVKASKDARRPRSSLDSAILCAGENGRVVRIDVDGWGAAYERRRIATQTFVDLRWDVERLVTETLKACDAFVRSQNSRRIRAAALGIDGPLRGECFADPTRLLLDVAAAEALHAQFGSDAAVRDWAVDQLRRFVGRYDAGCVIQVRGRILAVPIELSSQQVVVDRAHQWDRPCWIHGTVGISPYGPDQRRDAFSAVAEMIAPTPLGDRTIVDGCAWPTPDIQDAIARSRRLQNVDDETKPTTEWRFSLETRIVGFAEAFC
jgi:hypothetical protein